MSGPVAPIGGPSAFYELALVLLAGVAERLAPVPSRRCVTAGEIAWDTCDCDGMLAVSIGRLYVASAFPTEQAGGTGSPCDGGDLTGELTIQVVRCAPGPDGDGNPPTCQQLESMAEQHARDAWLARQGAWCTLKELRRGRLIEAFRLTSAPPRGPQGGCLAAELGATVAVAGGCGCDG